MYPHAQSTSHNLDTPFTSISKCTAASKLFIPKHTQYVLVNNSQQDKSSVGLAHRLDYGASNV